MRSGNRISRLINSSTDQSRWSSSNKALHAYDQCEQNARNRQNIEVVLLGAESIQTIKRTHSSYFESGRLDELLPA